MSTYEWATWLKQAITADPVLAPRLIEIAGWQTRGRPPSSFSFFPSGIIDHHTACFCRIGHDPQTCINGILAGNASAPGPISQLLVTATPPGTKWTGNNLDPRIILIAAGRSNHAGTGTYRWGAPGGNGGSIGIEGCGPFANWPDGLVDIRERLTAAIVRNRLTWTAENVDTHYGYATPRGRKIDPSGAWVPQPQLGLTDPWHPDIWRARIANRLNATPPPPPPTPPATIGAPLKYLPLARATRVLDTREPGDGAAGGNNNRPIAGGQKVFVHAYRAAMPPTGVKAVAVNVTAVQADLPGYLTVYPFEPRPNASAVNYPAGGTVAGFTIVPISGYGTFEVFTSATAHIIADVVGFYVDA